MTAKEFYSVLIAGLVAGGLFLVIFSAGLGFLFMFLPTLPLFTLGMGRHPPLALAAAAIAAVIIAIFAGPAAAALFLLFLGLPAWYFSKESLRARGSEEARQWYPIGLILLHLTLYACCGVALMSIYYDLTIAGGMSGILGENVREAFSDVKDEYGEVIETLATSWTFLIFSITIWLWGMALYAHAWIAHRALRQKMLPPRPDLATRPFTMPAWMLSLLAICALASLIGSAPVRFLGQSTLISLMLPYFFSGAALMHQASKAWPSRRFFLFFIYFAVFAQFWPALVLAGVGLWQQIKHLSGRGNWFKH